MGCPLACDDGLSKASSRTISEASLKCKFLMPLRRSLDGKASPLAHLPSGHFNANAAWLILCAMSFNLMRAAGALASTFHTRATTATIRAHLVNVPARLSRSARRLILHLPRNWPWADAWQYLFTTVHAPPDHV